jgi:LCP family protein required for cell wall assembly
MVTTSPHGDSDQPDQRWTGRARVSTGSASTTAQPSRRTVPPPAPPSPPGPPTYGNKKRPRPRWGRIALVSVVVLALLAGVGVLSTYLWVKNVDDGLKRTDPFADVAGRPQKLIDGTLNILLLGSDSRDPSAPVAQASQWRTDTIMVMHIPADHKEAYLISLPRDLWLHIPRSKDGQSGNTNAKINAAYAWGGTPLMVQTVEEYTGVRMDHVVLIDFAGFVKVTDALGGVDMNVDRTITSIFKPYRTFKQGPNHFNGTEALDYVRQRYQFPDGDFSRVRHQQQFLKALLDKAVSAGTLANVSAFKDFVSSSAAALTVDKDFSLFDLGWQFRNLRSQNLIFMVSPNKGSGTMNGESVVLSDKPKALALYDAVAKDTLATYLANATPSAKPGG